MGLEMDRKWTGNLKKTRQPYGPVVDRTGPEILWSGPVMDRQWTGNGPVMDR